MKFMVSWSIDQEKWIPILEKWTAMTPEQRADAGDGAKIIGRWHDMASRTGVAILEASDASAAHRYIGQWNPHMEIDIAPVVDDDESAEVAKAILASQGG
jgi:hypothetical protein